MVWEREEHENRDLMGMATQGLLSCLEAGDKTVPRLHICVTSRVLINIFSFDSKKHLVRQERQISLSPLEKGIS